MTALEIRQQSLSAFLAWEETQPERFERVSQMIQLMTGGTVGHNRILRNLAGALTRHLEGSGCEAFTSDVKVVSPAGDVLYPDIVVSCGEIPGQATVVEAPVVVVEVLSASTAARDHGPERWAYWAIPSLKHYVLIDQNQPVVEVTSPAGDGTWRSLILRGLDGRLRLDALDFEIGLDQVFARITFAPPAASAAANIDQS